MEKTLSRDTNMFFPLSSVKEKGRCLCHPLCIARTLELSNWWAHSEAQQLIERSCIRL